MRIEPKQCVTCGESFHRPSGMGFAQFAGRRFCSRRCVRRVLKATIIAPYRSTKVNGRRVAVFLKINGRAITGFRYKQYEQRADLTPEQTVRLVRFFEELLDETAEGV